ncbi:MAG: hypothetical protein J5669_03860 [Bacteroidales bacterium]|nr:hypothetical protein [Bacteroidales bacterium]
MRFALRYIPVLFLLVAGISACCLVDEDMRDCETDYRLEYQLRLVTNMTTELQTQLSMASEVSVSNAMRTYLGAVFTDHAYDVDLAFYDVDQDSTILHHEAHIMDASQSSYTLYIPVRRYMHLASANLSSNPLLSIENGEYCHKARVVQEVRDTVPSHKSGFYTARLPMDIKEGEDQQFDVHLYMANCATAIMVDTLGSGIRDIKVYLSGFATGFDMCDSLYQFNYTPIVRADRIQIDEPGYIAYTAVHFPSRPATDSKVVINTDDPSVSEMADHPLWHFRVYTTLADGTTTETLLGVSRPIKPGQFKLLKAHAYTNGTVAPGDPSVSMLVTPDWSPGLDIPVNL